MGGDVVKGKVGTARFEWKGEACRADGVLMCVAEMKSERTGGKIEG